MTAKTAVADGGTLLGISFGVRGLCKGGAA
jgi:hypothetical protein